MKKLINTALVYAILALVSGLFYSEFTKINRFTGSTTLSIMHVHLFALGMLFFLILVLLDNQFGLSTHRLFNLFFAIYNSGLAITVGAFFVKGILQTLDIELSNTLAGALSGVAGFGHILVAAGLIVFYIILRQRSVQLPSKPMPAS